MKNNSQDFLKNFAEFLTNFFFPANNPQSAQGIADIIFPTSSAQSVENLTNGIRAVAAPATLLTETVTDNKNQASNQSTPTVTTVTGDGRTETMTTRSVNDPNSLITNNVPSTKTPTRKTFNTTENSTQTTTPATVETSATTDADTVEYTYEPGDTFGEVIRKLNLETDNGLWGEDGDVSYYTQQLMAQGALDQNSNIPIGTTIKLRRRGAPEPKVATTNTTSSATPTSSTASNTANASTTNANTVQYAPLMQVIKGLLQKA